MSQALFAFDDRHAAYQAKERLVAQGISGDAVRFHGDAPSPHDPVVAGMDEVASGGFLHNMSALMNGLFERDSRDPDSAALADIIQRGGAVMGVHAHTEREQRLVEEVMAQTRPTRRTNWHV